MNINIYLNEHDRTKRNYVLVYRITLCSRKLNERIRVVELLKQINSILNIQRSLF
jgi:hypothetical protein